MDDFHRWLFVADLSLRGIMPLGPVDYESDVPPIFMNADRSQFLIESVFSLDPRVAEAVGGSVPAWVIALAVLGGVFVLIRRG